MQVKTTKRKPIEPLEKSHDLESKLTENKEFNI